MSVKIKLVTDMESIYYPLEWCVNIDTQRNRVFFLDQIYHPNVNFTTGEVSQFLIIKWQSSSMKKDLESFYKFLIYILDNPDPNCVENMESANDIKNLPWDFIRKLKKYGKMPQRIRTV